ncbi:MAG TPA: ABC transporter permease subunit [Methylomirabilota bacterium]|nr:ABC transporter permease subunit [Methylomirabilota bacterium]
MALAVPLGLLALWELLARLAVVSPRYFPPPTRTASVLAGSFSEGELGGETLITLGRLAAAFALAAVPAVPLGLLMGLVKPVRTAVEPYIAFLFPVPKIALLPFLLILFGVGEPAFVLTGALSAFFQITLSTLAGVQTMDPRLLDVGRNYGAHGARLFGKVILPAALPSVFTGLRLGLGLALVAVVAVEFIAAKSGLGHLVYRHWQTLSTPEMYGAFALVGALGLLLTRGLRALQGRMLVWQEEPGRL